MSNANSPAFPVITDGHGDPGLTKREYFAAMAMQGILAKGFGFKDDGPGRVLIMLEQVSSASVKMADFLVAELSIQRET